VDSFLFLFVILKYLNKKNIGRVAREKTLVPGFVTIQPYSTIKTANFL
jgi:hypothetical protein